jgi:hypothetical protein
MQRYFVGVSIPSGMMTRSMIAHFELRHHLLSQNGRQLIVAFDAAVRDHFAI